MGPFLETPLGPDPGPPKEMRAGHHVGVKLLPKSFFCCKFPFTCQGLPGRDSGLPGPPGPPGPPGQVVYQPSNDVSHGQPR